MSLKPQCGNCNAFSLVGDPNHPEHGVCRAHPPVPIMVGVQARPGLAVAGAPQQMPVVHGYHPTRIASEWCREWQPDPSKIIFDNGRGDNVVAFGEPTMKDIA